MACFDKAFVQNLSKTRFGHHLILISLDKDDRVDNSCKPFMFKMVSMKHNDFDTFIKNECQVFSSNIFTEVASIKNKLLKWNSFVLEKSFF